MKPVWLIEGGVYGAEADPLLAEIRQQGMQAEVVPFLALQKKQSVTVQSLADEACVIGYGTFPFVRQIQLHHRWVPGAFANPANLDCTCYFDRFGKFLLNQNYAIFPGTEAIRQQERLFKEFGKDEKVFARPTACDKLFTGRLISKEDFAAALAMTRFDPSTLVVIAVPRLILREWRLVIVKNQVVAASQYAEDGKKSLASGCPKEVQQFVEGMLAEVAWRPDPVFMMDVGEADGHLWLIELNGFSCSWLYRCDLTATVSQVSELTGEEWEKSRR